MKVTYDASVDAAYIYLNSGDSGAGEVEFTYACDPNEVGGMVHLDFDRNGVLLGIEVLAASKLLPGQLLVEASSDD
ncbi:MAG: DUF2283 domain-containing protein [Microthrixaceae bacterium]